MVTEDNLRVIGHNLFVTRLPFTNNEACRVVSEAIAEDKWDRIGLLNQTPSTVKRPATHYSITEKKMALYGQEYRAVVVHSTAHDKRRLKRINREIQHSEKALRRGLCDELKREYFCRSDAEVTVSKLTDTHNNDLHRLEISITEKIRYKRGRPRKNKTKQIASVRYLLNARIAEKSEEILVPPFY